MASDKYCYCGASIPKESETRERYKFTRLSEDTWRNTTLTYARIICFQADMGEDIFTRQVQTRYLGKRFTKLASRGLAPSASGVPL